MKKESSERMLKRVFQRALFITLVLIAAIFFFTKSALYCIIFFVGSSISFLGLYLMIRVVDRIIFKRSGKWIFLLSGLGKMILISVIFVIVAGYPEPAVIFYLFGLSVIILSITGEAVRQVFRSFRNGT